jgi:hypothetical protein
MYPPEAGWLPILVASYDTLGLRWDYSYSPVNRRGYLYCVCVCVCVCVRVCVCILKLISGLFKQIAGQQFSSVTCYHLTKAVHAVLFPNSLRIKYSYMYGYKIRDSSVGIALGYGLDDRGSGVRYPAGAGNFSLHHCVKNGSGVHPASIQLVPGALSLG